MKNNLKHFASNVNPTIFTSMNEYPINKVEPILSGTCDVGSPLERDFSMDSYVSYRVHQGCFVKHIPRTKRHKNRFRIVEQKVF